MKKLIPTISLIISCIFFASCSNPPTNTNTEISTNTTAKSQPETSPETDTPTVSNNTQKSQPPQTKTPEKPQIGTVKELVNGDLLCYVTLVDEQGKENGVGASFEICAEEEKFLNKKVRGIYTIESINDCESAEPCGKTRQESIITKMEVVENEKSSNSDTSKNNPSATVSEKILTENPASANNTKTISNGEWTITTSNHNSWTGVNNTGNLTYKGCNAKGQCIELSSGKISCREGICVTGWDNGDYVYILEQPITEDENASPTLVVKKGTEEILKATGFRVLSTN